MKVPIVCSDADLRRLESLGDRFDHADYARHAEDELACECAALNRCCVFFSSSEPLALPIFQQDLVRHEKHLLYLAGRPE